MSTNQTRSKPQIVVKKSEHIKWKAAAHKGKVNCICVRVVKQAGFCYVYTGGSDGTIKVWNGATGTLIQNIFGISQSAISCITYSNTWVLLFSPSPSPFFLIIIIIIIIMIYLNFLHFSTFTSSLLSRIPYSPFPFCLSRSYWILY